MFNFKRMVMLFSLFRKMYEEAKISPGSMSQVAMTLKEQLINTFNKPQQMISGLEL